MSYNSSATVRVASACVTLALVAANGLVRWTLAADDVAPARQDAAVGERATPGDLTERPSNKLMVSRPNPADYPHVHNLLQLTERIYSGGEPEGETAFEELARLGVKVVVSVDGTRPNIDNARKHGLRYIHIPIGYDGIPAEAGEALAHVVRETQATGDPLYFHCHHGKHRGPSAAAVACVAADAANGTAALEVLRAAGTGQEYAGLWRDVAAYRPPPSDAELPELVEVAEVDSIVTAMSQVDHALDRLKLCQENQWRAPADHSDLAPTQDAVIIREGLHEIGRTMADDYDERFKTWLAECEALAANLQLHLGVGGTPAADHTMVKLNQSCARCHTAYRN